MSEQVPGVEDFLQMIMVTNMRIYDVLLLLLSEQSEEKARLIEDRHRNFGYMGPMPFQEAEDE